MVQRIKESYAVDSAKQMVTPEKNIMNAMLSVMVAVLYRDAIIE